MIDSIAIGADHAGYELKEELKTKLSEFAKNFKDFGPDSGDSVDYPDFAHPVAKAVEEGEFSLGILICGSANGPRRGERRARRSSRLVGGRRCRSRRAGALHGS